MKRCVGARLAVACSTRRTMRLTVLSAAAAVTRTRSSAAVLTDPATTASPGPRATGTLSPVTGLSSTADCPSSTRPSQGTRSPGRTCTTSPTARPGRGHFHHRPVPFHPGHARHQPRQRADAGPRPPGGHAFQQLAHREQQHHDGRLLGRANRHGPKGGRDHQGLDGERGAGPRQRQGTAPERQHRGERGGQVEPVCFRREGVRERPGHPDQDGEQPGQPRLAGAPPGHARFVVIVPVCVAHVVVALCVGPLPGGLCRDWKVGAPCSPRPTPPRPAPPRPRRPGRAWPSGFPP